MIYNIETHGQVFTPDNVVQMMLNLRKYRGRTLEPSCGDGAFYRHLMYCTAIELDPRHAPTGSLNIDFFDYPISEKFETIIGNPPYVKHQNINNKHKLNFNLFDKRSNLYLFFIEKCIQHLAPHGELIFITPRDFMKATSSVKLNEWMATQGTITHAVDLGDSKIFKNAVPNCLIWRFEKDNFNREMDYAIINQKDNLNHNLAEPPWQKRLFLVKNGQICFALDDNQFVLNDLVSIKVGAVSGADHIYANEQYGNRDFVCSSTIKTGKTRKMIWADSDTPPACLLPYKHKLMQRLIKKFDETNWWHWGRSDPQTNAPRLYVNNKTRQKKPFFQHDCTHYDGAILGIFPRHPKENPPGKLQFLLNELPWEKLGFYCDGRYLFTQRSLANVNLPNIY